MLFTPETDEGVDVIYKDLRNYSRGYYNGIIETVALLKRHHKLTDEAARDVEILLMTTAHMSLGLLKELTSTSAAQHH